MNSAFRSRRCTRAFSLLEVLTAMGVFCFAVMGLLYALNITIEASRETQRQRMVRSQLESRLARLSLPPLNEFSANTEEDGIRYTEEIRPESLKSSDLSLLVGYWRVRVLAEWKDGVQSHQWDASHLIWNP